MSKNVETDPLMEFIEDYIEFILDSEAQRLSWRHHPCNEWLEDMVDQWDVIRQGLRGYSLSVIESIDLLTEEIIEFYCELDEIGERSNQVVLNKLH